MPTFPAAIRTLERDLRNVFGTRLQSILAYGLDAAAAARSTSHGAAHHHNDTVLLHTMAVVDTIGAADLRACTERVAAWHDEGLATPLILSADELAQSLDAFPFEFGAIQADHAVVAGRDPFDGLRVDPADLRRACEVQARSHLLHLRQAFVETRGRADALAVLVVDSVPALSALLIRAAHLEGIDAANASTAARHYEQTLATAPAALTNIVTLAGVQEIASRDAVRLFPPYLDAIERLTRHVDGWRKK